MFSSFRLNTISIAAAAAASDTYWYSTFGSNSSAYAIATDSSGNVYLGGQATVTNPVAYVIKLPSNSSSITWQRYAKVSSTGDCPHYGLAVDSSGNVYGIGSTTNAGGGYHLGILTKWNSSGTFQFINQWVSSFSGSSMMYGRDIVIDSSGNPITQSIGYPTSTATYGLCTHKWSTAGTLTASNSNLTTASSGLVTRLAQDSSGNIYAVGACSTAGQTAGGSDFFISKFNSSLVSQWRATIGDAQAQIASGVAVGSDGSIYITGFHSLAGAGQVTLFIAKIANAGTSITWQKQINADSSTTSFATAAYPSIAIDSSDNIYVTANIAASTSYIFKYNSSGTQQWKRSITGIGVHYLTNIKITSNNVSMVMSGFINSTAGGFALKLPVDGTRTGTWGSLVYAATTTPVESTPTLAITTRTTTQSTAPFTDNAETTASGSTTLTKTTQSIT